MDMDMDMHTATTILGRVDSNPQDNYLQLLSEPLDLSGFNVGHPTIYDFCAVDVGPTPASSPPFHIDVSLRKTARSPFIPCAETAEQLFGRGVHSKTIRVRVFVDSAFEGFFVVSASTKRPAAFVGDLPFLLLSTDDNHNREEHHFQSRCIHTRDLELNCFTFFVRPIYKSCPPGVKPPTMLSFKLCDNEGNTIVKQCVEGWVRSRIQRRPLRSR